MAQSGPGAVFSSPAPLSIWIESSSAGTSCDEVYLSGFELLADEDHPDGCDVRIRLRGTITAAGSQYLRRIADRMHELSYRATTIALDSRGGDARAAFTMALTIRRHPAFRSRAGSVRTEVSSADTAACFSACLLLFAAGTERHAAFDIAGNSAPLSRLGIHQPAQYRSADGRFDTDETNPAVQRVARQLRQYFSGVGVSPDIVDAMFEVPFDDIRLLNREDALRFGLIRRDEAGEL